MFGDIQNIDERTHSKSISYPVSSVKIMLRTGQRTRCCCVGMHRPHVKMCGFVKEAAKTFKAHLGDPNTYQGLLLPRNSVYKMKGTANRSEVASRYRGCQQNKLCLVKLPR